jgi:hypothetical protein
MCMAILFCGTNICVFPTKKNGKFSQMFFHSVNSISFANLLEKNCKIFQHQNINFLLKSKKKKEILLFKIYLN